jgi:hypothetical protein
LLNDINSVYRSYFVFDDYDARAARAASKTRRALYTAAAAATA